jgi:hypothetical protein
MRTAVRARRVLVALDSYQAADESMDWPIELAREHLGEIIGCYRNPGPRGGTIGIFADGLAWSRDGKVFDFAFEDLEDVTLPDGKDSEELLLRLGNGDELRLPVAGRRGRFRDSMEMLRFLDRVRRDRQK